MDDKQFHGHYFKIKIQWCSVQVTRALKSPITREKKKQILGFSTGNRKNSLRQVLDF